MVRANVCYRDFKPKGIPGMGESTAETEKTLDGYAADVKRLLRQQAALATFGSFAFRETDLLKILNEAARICAECLNVPFCKVCRYRPKENDLLIEAGAVGIRT